MPLRIAHVTASPLFGGVERIILDTSRVLQRTKDVEHVLASFSEGGRADAFIREVEKAGLTAYRFRYDTPRLVAATFEYIRLLKQHQIQILCAHGYKARMLGWFAAKWLRIPIIGVSHSWTSDGISHSWTLDSRKVLLYDSVDKWMHRRMDHIVCVSQALADKVVRLGVPANRVTVIRNSIRMDRFEKPSDISFRHRLESMFPKKPKLVIGTAARLEVDKGIDILITVADRLLKSGLDIGFVIFGEGCMQQSLQKQIDDCGIYQSVLLAGITDQLDKYMYHFDLFVLPSIIEGLPSVLLEAMAANTAVVATRVGGTGELVVDGSTGLMVPPNDPDALASAMQKVLCDDELRRTMGENGRQRVEQSFAIEAQAETYWELFRRFVPQTSQ